MHTCSSPIALAILFLSSSGIAQIGSPAEYLASEAPSHALFGLAPAGRFMFVDGESRGNVTVTGGDDGTSTSVTPAPEDKRSRLSRAAHDVGSALTRMALLFVFGCIMLALAPQRMEKLRLEAAARPMRSFALGLVSILAGAVGFVVLCVTVIGVPVALVCATLAVFGTYASIVAALTTAGAAVLQHRTQNPYLHLLLGCGALLVVGAIPVIGGLVTFVLACMGVGILVGTRAAGLIKPKQTT